MARKDAVQPLLALMTAVAVDIEEHWEDDDYLDRPDPGRALYGALSFCLQNGIDPPVEAMTAVGRFFFLQNQVREGGEDNR